MNKIKIFFLTLCLAPLMLLGQDIEYGVQLDTTHLMIGDQQHVTFQVESETPIQVEFPALREAGVEKVEILDGPTRDSIQNRDGSWLYREKYLVTAFDSGYYQIPSLPIRVEGGGFNNVLRTDPIGFVVQTVQVDTTKGNVDIIMPKDAPVNLAEAMPFILYSLLGLLIIGLFVWLYLRWKKRQNGEEGDQVSAVDPYEHAISMLGKIKNEQLWQAGNEKLFYTELTDMLRGYLAGEVNVAAQEMTSSEIKNALKGVTVVSGNDKMALEELLATADYVKFAKFIPLQDDNKRYLQYSESFIQNTHQTIERIKQEEEEARKKSESQTDEELKS